VDHPHEFRAPEGRKLFPHQNAAVAFASNLGRCLIGCEMGTGKTATAITFINLVDDFYKRAKVLVLCPASLKGMWCHELNSWMMETPEITVPSTKKPKVDTPIAVVNYDIVWKLPELQNVDWDILIMDECHAISNPEAKRSNAVKSLSSTYALALTGTPIPNKPINLWNTLDLLQPGAWGSYHEFGIRYAGAFKKYNPFKKGRDKTEWQYKGATNTEELNSRLRSSVMIRRLKEQVIHNLPDKIESQIPIEKDNRVARGYARYQLMDDDRPEKQGTMAKLHRDTGIAKVNAALEIIENKLSSGRKLVVFAVHKGVLDAIQNKYYATSVRICGSTAQKDRQPAVERFQTDPQCTLFIGNIRAAGAGITLTAASDMLFVEMSWSEGDMKQAAARCHRIGQTESVQIDYMVLEESLDANILRSVRSKEANNKKILD